MIFSRLVLMISAGLLVSVLGSATQQLQGRAPQESTQGPAHPPQTTEQMQRLVAPIALYPDALVAQILAASTFPEQVVQADRWVQAHPGLKGQALGAAVDGQPWDGSVKALTAFPAVLGNMDKNLSWTSSMGDAYYNQQDDMMDAVQVMRRRAEGGGRLKSTPQQTVANTDSTITIEPTNPEVIYVPAYDPWAIYGDPMEPWPGWYAYPGISFGGPFMSFGVGFGIGWGMGFGWGWSHWGFDWHGRYATFNHGRYMSRGQNFSNRSGFRGAGFSPSRGGGFAGGRGGFAGGRGGYAGGRGGFAGGRGASNGGGAFHGNPQGARGYGAPGGNSGVHSGAFSGMQHGGGARGFSSRGGSSMGGGGHHR